MRWLMAPVLIAGAVSAFQQRLIRVAWRSWENEKPVDAVNKFWKEPSYHRLKNIGQELVESWIDADENGQLGKIAYKVGSALIVMAFAVGLIIGLLL